MCAHLICLSEQKGLKNDVVTSFFNPFCSVVLLVLRSSWVIPVVTKSGHDPGSVVVWNWTAKQACELRIHHRQKLCSPSSPGDFQFDNERTALVISWLTIATSSISGITPHTCSTFRIQLPCVWLMGTDQTPRQNEFVASASAAAHQSYINLVVSSFSRPISVFYLYYHFGLYISHFPNGLYLKSNGFEVFVL